MHTPTHPSKGVRMLCALAASCLLLAGCHSTPTPPVSSSENSSFAGSSPVLSSEPAKESEKAPEKDRFSLDCRKEGDQGTVAVWWWNAKWGTNEKTRDTYLDFLEKNDVNRIYFCYPNFRFEKLATFVRAAGQRGMQVCLLSGDASFLDEGNPTIQRVIEEYLAYQAQASESEKLAALHLDVEPHQKEDFATRKEEYLVQYAALVCRVGKQLREQGEKIEWDIPFWLDGMTVPGENGSEELLALFARNADTLTLMSYRNRATAILSLSEREIALCREYGTTVICGVDCASEESPDVSFRDGGKKALAREVATVYHRLAEQTKTTGYGVAIHFLDTWYQLKDQ